jgi:hypothetical protein
MAGMFAEILEVQGRGFVTSCTLGFCCFDDELPVNLTVLLHERIMKAFHTAPWRQLARRLSGDAVDAGTPSVFSHF